LAPVRAMLRRVGPADGDNPAVVDLTPLQPGHELSVGRSSNAKVALASVALPFLASRKHARLVLLGGSVALQDLGSTNGTCAALPPAPGTGVTDAWRLVSGCFPARLA